MTVDSLFNILLIILGFGLLIGIHELGHFLAAKWSGIRTNAFAVGMGPQVISFRKGIGLCFKSTRAKVIAKYGKDANDMTDAELGEHGISETEYSLRLLPIGGFVSMLGQEDGKPEEVSNDPRSYNKCPIGKRMVVVSAGVMMNLLLAGLFFLICFQIGVNFEAPIIGEIIPNSPASKAMALGDKEIPLESGDTIVSIDGSSVATFQNIQIAGAMSKPGVPLLLEVEKQGHKATYEYSILPEQGALTGMLEIGLMPAMSLTLRHGNDAEEALAILQTQYPELDELKPGMTMIEACTPLYYSRYKEEAFKPVKNLSELRALYSGLVTQSILTKWSDGKTSLVIEIPTQPELNILRPVGIPEDAPQNYELGFMGLVPLPRINYILDASPNVGTFEQGDVIVRVDTLEFPRMGQLRNFLTLQPDGELNVTVLRDNEEVSLLATLKDGKLGVLLANALDVPITAQPLEEVLKEVDGALVPVATPIAGYQILGGSRFVAVYDAGLGTFDQDQQDSIATWRWFLFNVDVASYKITAKGPVMLVFENPTKNAELVQVKLDGPVYPIQGQTTPLAQQLFEPLYVTRSSRGNPIKALQMGFDETVNMVVMTYLTIDRLFRRTIGVDQLRGPVGIIHIGSKIADRGMSYLLFFLAIISVNLAVLNFLPLPIVDGGLFLYLIYEKLFKKPPSIAFQNAAAMLGLGLIATLFIVTFYNDIARLVG